MAYLIHHGVQGQKWGVRRYQNEDGSLTAAGKERYGGQREYADTRVRSWVNTSRFGYRGGKSAGDARAEALSKKISQKDEQS